MSRAGQEQPLSYKKHVDTAYLRELHLPLPTVTVLTGATGGIGGEVARRLAAEGHVLVLPGRSRERSEGLCRELRASSGNPHVYWVSCDLASLESVRRAADEIDAALPRIDVLINNAGIFGGGREIIDGFERHLLVNYLSPFLLTHRLLPKLEQARGRIVNVAGETARFGTLRLDDLNRSRRFSVLGAYAQTKLALICFARTLAEQLEGRGVDVVSLTPGIAGTDHLASAPRWLAWLWRKMPGPERAGAAVVRRVLDPRRRSGAYFLGSLPMIAPSGARRRHVRDALYAKSAELVGLEQPL